MRVVEDNDAVRLITIEFTERELAGILNALQAQGKASSTTHCVGGTEDAPDVLGRKVYNILTKK